MMSSVCAEIHMALKATESLYHRMVLVVGETKTGKTFALREVAESFNVDVINVNLVVSTEFLDLTTKQRMLGIHDILARITDNPHSPIILDNLEILFDKGLMQNPLRILQGISRNRSVLASWNGRVLNGNLIYAKQGHSEYRKSDISGVPVVILKGTAYDRTRKENREATQS